MGIIKRLENIFAASGLAEEGDPSTAKMIMAEDKPMAGGKTPETAHESYKGLTPPAVGCER